MIHRLREVQSLVQGHSAQKWPLILISSGSPLWALPYRVSIRGNTPHLRLVDFPHTPHPEVMPTKCFLIQWAGTRTFSCPSFFSPQRWLSLALCLLWAPVSFTCSIRGFGSNRFYCPLFIVYWFSGSTQHIVGTLWLFKVRQARHLSQNLRRHTFWGSCKYRVGTWRCVPP